MSDNVNAAELRQLIDRILRIEDEITNIKDDRKDIYLEVKSRGYDTKTTRAIVALMKMDKDKRNEAQALLDTYMASLGLS